MDINHTNILCRLWRTEIERPEFWTSCRLRVNDNEDKVSEVMQSRMIKLVPKIEILKLRWNQKTAGMFGRLFKAVVAEEVSQLKNIRILFNYLSSICPELLSQAADFISLNFKVSKIFSQL